MCHKPKVVFETLVGRGGALMLAFWYWHGGPNFRGNHLKGGRGVGLFLGKEGCRLARRGVIGIPTSAGLVGIPIDPFDGGLCGCCLTGGPICRASSQHIWWWLPPNRGTHFHRGCVVARITEQPGDPFVGGLSPNRKQVSTFSRGLCGRRLTGGPNCWWVVWLSCGVAPFLPSHVPRSESR